MSSKRMNFSNCCKFQSTPATQKRNKAYPNTISKINQVVFKSVLEPNCKRLSKSAIRENLQFKTWPTDEKTSIWTTVHQYLPNHWRKSEVYPNFFAYVWKTFQHHLQVLYASQNVQVFPSLTRPKACSWQQRGKQWLAVTLGSFIILQKTAAAVSGREHQKTVNFEKSMETEKSCFQK